VPFEREPHAARGLSASLSLFVFSDRRMFQPGEGTVYQISADFEEW
jgi:hypothetical protein